VTHYSGGASQDVKSAPIPFFVVLHRKFILPSESCSNPAAGNERVRGRTSRNFDLAQLAQ
jgi:hypothetical protein